MSEPEERLDDLREVLNERIRLGEDLLKNLSQASVRNVIGLAKLEKKVRQEVKFLGKFLHGDKIHTLKKEHILCSNLVHLNSIISQLFRVDNPVSVMQPFNLSYADGTVEKKVNVDIVCDGGFCWVKVVARNPKALQLNSQGGSQYGQRSILDQVREFVKCSKQNQKMFKSPKVLFVFANGVTRSLANTVQKKGACVFGEVIECDDSESLDSSDSQESDEEDAWDAIDEQCDTSNQLLSDNRLNDECLTESEEDLCLDESRLNLDITAMIAYVSSLTNGQTDHIFKEKILCQQASWEKNRPVKPFLDKVFCDKNLICCESALKDFKSIIECLGGATEKERATQLLMRLTVVPDRESNKIKNLEISGKIKNRSRAIFGTGDFLRVVTVTANSGFVRAAKGQGVNLAVVLHESRALTEDKQSRALSNSSVQ